MKPITKSRDKACLSYWFPKLEASGVLVPRTEIVTTDAPLWRLTDPGSTLEVDGLAEFWRDMINAVDKLGGLPIFLRTGHLSGKYDWSETCHVRFPESNEPPVDTATLLVRHISTLVEYSEMVDIIGLPTKVWAAREFLPLLSPFTAYQSMPVAREFRVFIEGGIIGCIHPYWPAKALEEGNPSVKDWYDAYSRLMTLNGQENRALRETARQVAEVFEGDCAWSLDIAQHRDGRWFAIDMAPAELSFHWEGCGNGERWKR